MAKKRVPKLKVVERKLGREGALGQCWRGENLIELDPRQRPRTYLSTLLHEVCHAAFPDASESQVMKAERLFIRTLWDQGYRKVIL